MLFFIFSLPRIYSDNLMNLSDPLCAIIKFFLKNAMSTYKSEGIIIRRHNFGESSLILDFYTKEHGKVEAVARSARKLRGKLKGHLELFLCTDLVFARARNIDKTTSSYTLKSFPNLRKNLRTSSIAYYFSELVEKMTIAGHRDERVYHLLKKSLDLLDEHSGFHLSGCYGNTPAAGHAYADELDLLVVFFQINMLDLAGYSAQFRKCVHCLSDLSPGKNSFSHSLGGVICSSCVPADPYAIFLNDDAIKLMRMLQFRGSNDAGEYLAHLKDSTSSLRKIKIEAGKAAETDRIMNDFIEFNIERKIKSIDLIRIL